MNKHQYEKNNNSNYSLRTLALTCTAVSALLMGCGGSSSDRSLDEHADADIDTPGRLAIYDQDNASIKVMDLNSKSILSSYSLPGEAPRLYASPNSRYAVVIQRSDDLVSFVDSGFYTEDHGDHMHDFVVDPSFLSFSLSASMPTHYSSHEDFSVVFFDGLVDGITSSVSILTDSGIGSGQVMAELTLANNMHGVAKLIEDQLFVTYRDPLITDTVLPAAVERYSFDGGSLRFEDRYVEECPLLHGSAATDEFITFGCGDGVLVINLTNTSYPATKLDNPETLMADKRIGSLYSHPDVTEFVGIAGNQIYVIDPTNVAAPYQELLLPDGVSRIGQGFDAHGEVFYVLGDDGKLYLFKVESDWSSLDPVAVAASVGDDDLSPAVTISQAEEKLFVLNTNGQQIIEVDSATGAIQRTIDLDFTASGLVWVGLGEHHDH